MTTFAKIENGIVVDMIEATQEVIDSNYSGTWIETKIDGSIRKRYASIGMSYNSQKDIFIRSKPHRSFILDENDEWQPPIPYPNDGKLHRWNENNKNWEL